MNFVESFNLFGTEAAQKACITINGAPTTSTEGAVGCLCMNTKDGTVYKCTKAVNGVYTWDKTGGMTEVATLTIPLTDYYEGEYTDGNGMSQWGKIPKIGGFSVGSDKMLLLEKFDEMNGRTANTLCSQLLKIFNSRFVSVSVFANDGNYNLLTPFIHEEMVGATMVWGGSIYSVDEVPSHEYADITHTVWCDNNNALSAGSGPYATYLKLSNSLYNALITALNFMDNSPEENELVFTAYN
jgi:hypothetical protein